MAKDVDISQLLIATRKKQKVTQKQLGQALGAHHGAVSMWEHADPEERRKCSAAKLPFIQERCDMDLKAELQRLDTETEELDALREGLGWSIDQLSKASGVNYHLLYDILRSGFYAKPAIMEAIHNTLQPPEREVGPLASLSELTDKEKLALADDIIAMVQKLTNRSMFRN
jgi:transcriptional regulator with XRE-family HTH domain